MFSPKYDCKIKKQGKLHLLALVTGALETCEWCSLSLLLGAVKHILEQCFSVLLILWIKTKVMFALGERGER